MSQEVEIKTIKPFGPAIAKVSIPKKILHELNTYIDNLIKDEKKSKEQDHGYSLVGNVKQEIKLEDKIIEDSRWKEFLEKCISIWIESITRKKINEFKLIDSWVVRQFQNEYNPAHWHNGHISGAGFLKVPSNFGQTIQKNKRINQNGNLSLIHGSRHFLNNSIFDITPIEGDLYFFPHYLMHTVYPFLNSHEERRSISFNARIDENIFNVHG